MVSRTLTRTRSEAAREQLRIWIGEFRAQAEAEMRNQQDGSACWTGYDPRSIPLREVEEFRDLGLRSRQI